MRFSFFYRDGTESCPYPSFLFHHLMIIRLSKTLKNEEFIFITKSNA